MGDLGDLDAARGAVEAAKVTVEAARMAMLTRRSAQDEVRREGEARVRRRQEAVKELSGWKHRLETASRRIAELAERKAETEEELAEASCRARRDRGKREELAEAIASGRGAASGGRGCAGRGGGCAARGAMAEREAERRRARRARRGRGPRRGWMRRARRGLCQPSGSPKRRRDAGAAADSFAKTDPEKMPDAETLDADVNRLKRQREALGAVNLRAEEDAKAVSAEYDTLASEKADLEEAIKKLRAGIAGLNREGRERLLTAFEQVNANFSTLFTHLFGGGEARLGAGGIG
jgi:chromosome segregation protein